MTAFASPFMPIRRTSRLYLERQLRVRGIPRDTIPIACLRKLVDQDIGAAKVLADRYMRSWRSDLPLYLDGTIASIEAILSGGRPDWKRQEVLQVLKEYKVVSDDSRALIAPSMSR
jgi:hypothetical protein